MIKKSPTVFSDVSNALLPRKFTLRVKCCNVDTNIHTASIFKKFWQRTMFYTDVVGVCGVYVYVIRMSQTNDLLMTVEMKADCGFFYYYLNFNTLPHLT